MRPSTEETQDGDEYKSFNTDTEREALLPSSPVEQPTVPARPCCKAKRQYSTLHLTVAFVAGALALGLAQYAAFGPNCFSSKRIVVQCNCAVDNHSTPDPQGAIAVVPPWVGSTTRHPFPPPSPTNAFPSLFPPDVGFPGGTPTGDEAAIIATAPSYPIHTGAAQLVAPDTLGKKGKGHHKGDYDMFRKWGNLSPWYSVDRGVFGLDSGPETPETCRVTGLHFLHRHGARYPTAWGEC